MAAANPVGAKRLYTPHPPATILKGVGLSVKSIGVLDRDEVLARQPGEDDVRYWKLVVRDGILVGAVLLGDWPEGNAIVDTVASGAKVSHMLSALRAGDLSRFGVDLAGAG